MTKISDPALAAIVPDLARLARKGIVHEDVCEADTPDLALKLYDDVVTYTRTIIELVRQVATYEAALASGNHRGAVLSLQSQRDTYGQVVRKFMRGFRPDMKEREWVGYDDTSGGDITDAEWGLLVMHGALEDV